MSIRMFFRTSNVLMGLNSVISAYIRGVYVVRLFMFLGILIVNFELMMCLVLYLLMVI